MEELLHGDTQWLTGVAAPPPTSVAIAGSISSEEEEAQLEALNTWIESKGLPRGILSYDFADQQTGQQQAVFDLVWLDGIQEELSQPVAVLLNEDAVTLAIASQAGFRCFTAVDSFRRYVEDEILAGGSNARTTPPRTSYPK